MNDIRPSKIPGGEGIWVFICGDLIVFSLFFLVFLDYRSVSPELFSVSANSLNLTFGLLNTLVLLTSSWFIVGALDAFRRNRLIAFRRLSLLALFCGVFFVVLKIFEYKEKILGGVGLTTNDFYMFYYVLTGIHLFHVLLGLGAIGWLLIASRPKICCLNSESVESVCVFWHMVDLLWIFIFPLLYLVA